MTAQRLEDAILKTKSDLKAILQNSVVTLNFKKVDGSKRKMRCTLLPKYLPEKMIVNEEVEVKEDTQDSRNVIAVWDLDVEEWRSFRVTSLIDLKIEA